MECKWTFYGDYYWRLSVFEQADVLLFMETWEAQDNALPTIEGFECIGSIFNAKICGKRRGYGGIAAYVKTHLQSMTSIEHNNSNNQFLVLRLQTKGIFSFIFDTYFAHLNMPIYKRVIVDASNPFASLSKNVHALKSQAHVWIVGDFNARIFNE
jgi:exonuclease III